MRNMIILAILAGLLALACGAPSESAPSTPEAYTDLKTKMVQDLQTRVAEPTPAMTAAELREQVYRDLLEEAATATPERQKEIYKLLEAMHGIDNSPAAKAERAAKVQATKQAKQLAEERERRQAEVQATRTAEWRIKSTKSAESYRNMIESLKAYEAKPHEIIGERD